MAERNYHLEFSAERAVFVSMLEEPTTQVTDALLDHRRDTVRAFEGLLATTQYVEVSGDFHLQRRPMGSGRLSGSGLSTNGLRLPSPKLWVGPYNHQTNGYAELDGGIHTLGRHGLLPKVAWRGEPRLSPGYPLIADMAQLAIKPIDARAEDFTATREFGINSRLFGPYWKHLEGKPLKDIYEILDTTVDELLTEDDSDMTRVANMETDVYAANLGSSFGYNNLFIAFAADGHVRRIEKGAFYGANANTRFDFVREEGSVSVVHRPHTSFNHRADYVPEVTVMTNLDEDRHTPRGMDFRQMLGDIERLVMAPVRQDNHVEGFGVYAKQEAA